ncbi:MAG TPA: ASKHA domain-containing protein [Bryobacteraceae bacterium]|nr:ASKHA domain-containing protein [Bryobacteraceae bacterium]
MPVFLTINGHTTAAIPGRTLFDFAGDVGVRVPTSCRKQGKCKECIVEIVEGIEALSAPTPSERHLKGNFRLSCQCEVSAQTGSVRCHTMRRGHMRIERQALGLPFTDEPLPPNPAVTREGDRILIDGAEIDRSTGPIHGLAMDLGTTTVVVRLFNLESGQLIADASFENPQRFGGSDVMSRIQYDSDHPGKLLRRTLAGYLSHTIEEFPVDPKTIYEMVVVGNSTMRDLFFRQSVWSIGQNPYRSITELEVEAGRRSTTSLIETGRRCLLPIHPKARVYGLPVISGHVGADAAACMLAVDLAHEDRLIAIMDIGTNTELIVGNRHRILAASCPAGPAFEGGAIACGMPALDGAIEEVVVEFDGRLRFEVIGGLPAEGICGSGLVALMSELMRTGQMNRMGRFTCDRDRIAIDEPRGIYFHESDVNELAQAKGANVAGLHAVFSNYGAAFGDVERFYLAGGFGRHMKVEAAQRIGLIPDIPGSRVVQAGNTAIEGASIALLSSAKRRELEALVKRVEHCRLETHPDFFDFFVEGCQFKPIESIHQVAG